MEVIAYILIEAQVGRSDDVIGELRMLGGIKSAHFVTGQYDVIAIVHVPTLADLNPLISRIQHIMGINKTVTCLVIDSPSVMDTSTF